MKSWEMARKKGNSKGPYNWIYKEIMSDAMSKDKHDIIGYVAYSIYKREKIEEIERFKNRNGGKDPEFADLKYFHEQSEGRIAEYRETAQRVLQNYMTNLGIEKEKESHGFIYGVGQSMLASLLFAILCYIFFLLVKNGIVSIPGIPNP